MEERLYAEILRLRKLKFDIFRTDIGFTYIGLDAGRDMFAFTFGSDDVTAAAVKEQQMAPHFLVESDHKQSHALEDFLVRSAPPLAAIDRDAMMSNFWTHTGKHFRLMDLPAELRCMIYKHSIFPTSGEQSSLSYRLKPQYRIESTWSEPLDHFRTNGALLRVSSKVSAEALHLLYTQAEFHFTKPEDCNTFFCSISAAAVQNIRYLSLGFTHMGYLRFFGARIGAGLSFVSAPSLDAIAAKIQAGDFEELTLYMPHPSCIASRQRTLCDKDFPCPKRVVDWILMAIYPWVQELDLQNLRLRGCVKEAQYRRFAKKLWMNQAWREQWAVRCREVDEEFHRIPSVEDDGGVDLQSRPEDDCEGEQWASILDHEGDLISEAGDEHTERADELLVDDTIPPMCTCRTMCSLSGFTTKE